MLQTRGVGHAGPCLLLLGTRVFPGGAVVKNLPACAVDARDTGSVPESGSSPGVENGNPVFLPGKLLGQRSLVGCSPWGCEESDMTEDTHAHSWYQGCLLNSHYTVGAGSLEGTSP